MFLKNIKQVDKKYFGYAAFLFPFFIYLLTTASTITSYADSAELITAAFNLDAAHPPGYPLFILLGKLFTFIPIGSIAYRVNLLSCVLGALTVFFVFKIFKKVGLSTFSSFLASQVIAFSYSFWLYSITAEVYALNNLLAITIIYLTILWGEKRKLKKKNSFKILAAISFLFGLAFSNHTSIILITPGIAYLIWIVDKRQVFKSIFKLIPFFILGLTPYLLLILFANKPHYPLFGNLASKDRLIAYLTRADYGGFLSAGPEYNPNISGILELFNYYLKLIFNRFTPIAPFLAIYFVIASFIKRQTVFIHLSIILITTALFFPLFSLKGVSASDFHSQGVIERFSLLGLLILGIVFVFSLHWVISELRPKKKKPIFQIITFLLAIYLFISNYSDVDKSKYVLAKNYALNILNQVEDNSIIFTSDDMSIFSLLYFVNAEKLKPNVVLINTGFLETPAYQKELKQYWPDLYQTDSTYFYDIARDIIKINQGKRPVYFVMLKDPYPYGFDGNPYFLSPMGLVLKADTETDKKTIEKTSLINYWDRYNLEGLNKNYQDPFAKLAKQNYYFRAEINARVYFKIGCLTCAQQDISILSEISDNEARLQEILALQQLPQPQIDNKTAEDFFASAQQNLEYDTGVDLYFMHRAIWDLTQAREIDPENEKVRTGLIELFETIGLFDHAKKFKDPDY